MSRWEYQFTDCSVVPDEAGWHILADSALFSSTRDAARRCYEAHRVDVDRQLWIKDPQLRVTSWRAERVQYLRVLRERDRL